MRFFRSLLILCACNAWSGSALQAQDAAIVDALAAVLAAEDGRLYNGPLFRSTARHPSALVRSRTALAIGRIGNNRGARVLLELTTDPDTMVQHDAIFALGLVGDTTTLDRLREYVLDARPNGPMFDEAVVATARIGGEAGAELIREMLNRWVGFSLNASLPSGVMRALLESWRLEDHAPVRELLQYAISNERDVRRNVIYSLSRLRAPAAMTVFFSAIDDPDPFVRQYAARALKAAFADSAGMDRRAVARRVERLVDDQDPGVRIEAIRTIGTYGGTGNVRLVANRATDSDPNVRVEAVAALGSMSGADAESALLEQLSGGLFAIEQQALLSLAIIAGDRASPEIDRWADDVDWRRRQVAARAYRSLGQAGLSGVQTLLWDLDPRVTTAALAAVIALDSANADSVASVFLPHDDEVVRSVAFGHLARRPSMNRLTIFIDGFELARHDRGGGTRSSIIRALGILSRQSPETAARIDRAFLGRYPTNTDFRDRLAAERSFPAASEQWGPPRPVVTDRSIDDYRDIVRETLLPALRGEIPQMIIETDRGTIILDLLPQVAPLTVQAYSELIDQRYFDGGAWHRVVPNFVVQDGDPRGDGRGSPGFVIRDEVSRMRYVRGTLGQARGARFDTGSSQFFLTLSPQPHLEGAYTIFGTIRSGADVLSRITVGDRIRRIRRIEQR